MRKQRTFTTRSSQEIKCRLDIPRTWYESKLAELEAKENKFTKILNETDSNRAAMYQMRCKLRYYDTHIEEANRIGAFKRDCMILSNWKKVFKENNGKKLWKDCCKLERMVKEQGIEAWPAVEHALEVISKYFERR